MSNVRLAARGLIRADDRLLVVNAFPHDGPNLWCAPGGGCEVGEAATATLVREVYEETGLQIRVGALAGISEFHNDSTGFHQMDLFFHATADGPLPETWVDPEAVVHTRRLVTRDQLMDVPHKPDFLAAMAFDQIGAAYHGLTQMVRPEQLGDAR